MSCVKSQQAGILDIVQVVHPDPNGRRFMVVITYKFDESYKDARSLVVGGWLGEENQWRDVQRHWCVALSAENETLPVGRKISRYHASEMNARDNEFGGWDDDRTLRLTKRLLNIVGRSGMTAVTAGWIWLHFWTSSRIANHQIMESRTECA